MTDVSSLWTQVQNHMTPAAIIFFVLFLASEALGANPNIKASSFYEIGKTLLMTFKDQVLPAKVEAPVTTETKPQ